MADAFFVLKSLIFTFLILVLMQIKISGVSAETHVQRWIRKSTVMENLKGVAHGAVAVIDKGYDAAVSAVDEKPSRKYGRDEQKASSLDLNFDRRNFKWDSDKKAADENENQEPSQNDDSFL